MRLIYIFALAIFTLATTMFGADKATVTLPTNQNFLDILQTMNGETSSIGMSPGNIPVVPNKMTQAQQIQTQDSSCARIIVDNKTVLYHCGDKTFLKRFGSDGGLFLILSDGKKVKLAD